MRGKLKHANTHEVWESLHRALKNTEISFEGNNIFSLFVRLLSYIIKLDVTIDWLIHWHKCLSSSRRRNLSTLFLNENSWSQIFRIIATLDFSHSFSNSFSLVAYVYILDSSVYGVRQILVLTNDLKWYFQ